MATFLLVFGLLPRFGLGATFNGDARIEISDPTGGLSWVTTNQNQALTISCWFKISIPSGKTLSENMTILVNRKSGSTNDSHAYLIWFNLASGDVEFSTRGNSGAFSKTLVERPFLDRWYHVAVVRQSDVFTGYVDGRQVPLAGGSVGNAATTEGVSIGGWGGGKYLYGEVQEVAIYQTAFGPEFIVDNMFKDQPALDTLRGYFKLAYSTNGADGLKNFAPTPLPSGTDAGTAQGGGKVEFEETNQAGEQSAFDSKRNGARDALAPLSGAFSWQQTALARATPGIALDFRFGYSSANVFGGFKLGSQDPYAAGALGGGWRHTFEARIVPAQHFSPLADTSVLGLMLWDGAIETWDKDAATGQYKTRSREYKGDLLMTATNCQWITPERLVYVFTLPGEGPAVMRGRLESIRDFNGNAVRVQWNTLSGVITQVVDTAGGRYSFNYRGSLLTNVSFGSWTANFAYDSSNRLAAKWIFSTNVLQTNVTTRWEFRYNDDQANGRGLLQRVLDPRGNTNVFVAYDKYARKVEERDALWRVTKTEYGVPAKRQMRHTDPEDKQWLETYDRKHRLLVQRDPLGNETKYTYDERGNRISITEPLLYTTTFGYDDRANVIARTNALGETALWTFHPFFNKATSETTPQPRDAQGWTTWTNRYDYDERGNLTNHSDALGSLVRYTYLTNGLVKTSTDANGNTTRFGYDTNGFQIATTDPANFTTTLGYNEVGWKVAHTNALNQVTTYGYDLNGNPVRVVDPLQRVFEKGFDPNGNLLWEQDAKQQRTTYAYDAANQRTNMVDRAKNTWSYTFTRRGKPEQTTDPRQAWVRNQYDGANRLRDVRDAKGSIHFDYDANGNRTNRVDKLNRAWRATYDRLNRVDTESDPEENTRRTTYDVAGRIREVLTPNGYPSTHTYDGRGRLTLWVDAESFPWTYQYDGVENITNIIDALGGHYRMGYDSRNARINEVNQDDFAWDYRYDPLLRLEWQRHPNGTERTNKYDAGGRVEFIAFSTGRVNAFLYDENNNPEVLSRSGSGPATVSRLAYDEMDRVKEYRDPFGNKLGYEYNEAGRLRTLTYPDGKKLRHEYDEIHRLKSQTFDDRHTVQYDYDVADRLVWRRYPNGVEQTNTFDRAGRMTGLQYQPSRNATPPATNALSIALTYAYDRNGNKTNATERGTLQWPLPSFTDEWARYTKSGRLEQRVVAPIAPPVQGPSGGEGQAGLAPSALAYHYDASGNMTNAVGQGQSWSFTYDEDNRVMTVGWQLGPLTERHIRNRYDALGRRVARTADGIESRYVLDVSGKMERILCDTDASGRLTAEYVHGADLCFKVDRAGALTCYHGDAVANIVALTGSDGTTLEQYAYTPYGRRINSTNRGPSAFSLQPFTFVGSQGVMEELPDLYFMRARYYSAQAGLFLSTDPIKHVGPGWKPAAYAYGHLNPIANNDPSGRIPPQVVGALIGGIVKGAGDIVSQVQQGKSLGSLDWGSVASEAAKGAIAGALVASGVNPVAAGAAASGLVEAATQLKNDIAADGKLDLDFDVARIAGSAAQGALEAAVDELTPTLNVSNKGLLYSGAVRGVGPNTWSAAFSSSQLRNAALNEFGYTAAWNVGMRTGHDLMERTSSAAGYAQSQSARYEQVASPSPAQGGTTCGTAGGGAGGSFSRSISSIATAVEKSANSVTKWVSNAANGTGQAISSAVTSAAKAVGNAATSVWNWISGKKGK